MKTFLKWFGLLLAVLIVAYLVGPTVQPGPIAENTPVVSADLLALEREIAKSESKAGLKPDNQARIVWADSLHKQKTPYSLVYLPGFGASWAEGDPVHKQLAKRFGCNLYLAREFEHGVKSSDAFRNLTPANYTASAESALAIGKALGGKVVVIGTSAGGMLTLYLAAHHPEIHGLVLYSPCMAVANPALKLVTRPWGKQIMDGIMGSEYVKVTHYTPDRANYWLTQYHTNGLITLQTMLDKFMTPETFVRVKQPVFMGYYYKDEEHQDKVVSVPAMLEMFDQLGTPADKKEKVAFPEAGDHVIASHFTSKDLNGVYQATAAFMEEVLGVKPAPVSKPNYAPTPTLAIQQKK
ncbi:alpha/beta hydrolase [Nibrella saemangeumensis]|uniref:Alpha/beta hydrolase n=1 Tax=Nibrella saemangeumensis TaxID=1084526 RepID=A0ABP8MC61_9BACT